MEKNISLVVYIVSWGQLKDTWNATDTIKVS